MPATMGTNHPLVESNVANRSITHVLSKCITTVNYRLYIAVLTIGDVLLEKLDLKENALVNYM